MGACKPKDKSITEKTLSQIEPLRLKSTAGAQIEALLEVEPRKTDNTEAQQALDAMGLGSASDALKWSSKTGENGNYTYTDVRSLQSDEGEFTIKTLQLLGVHMKDDKANFDRLSAKGIELKKSEEEYGSIARLEISNPGQKLTSNIGQTLNTITDKDRIEDAVKLETKGSFGALYLENINLVSPDVNLKAGSLGMAEDKETQKAVFLIKDINTKMSEDSQAIKPNKGAKKLSDITMSLAEASGTGIDMEIVRAVIAANDVKNIRSRANDPSKMLLNSLDFYKQTFDTLEFSNFNVNFDSLDFNAPSYQSQSRNDGDVLIVNQVFEPATLTIGEGSENPSIIQARKSLNDIGYEKLVFQGRRDTRLNKAKDTALDQGLFELKDGFRFSREIKIGNFKQITEALTRLQKEGADLNETPEAFYDLEVHSLGLSLEDLSLVDRGFKFAAQQQGTSEKILRAQAKAALLLLGLGAKTQAQGDLISQASKAMGKFIENGGTLDLSFNPENPVSIGELVQMDPNSFDWDKLGFTAATTP